MVGIIGRKLGMTRLFGERGEAIPVTVIEAGPCYVTQVKTEAKDGYNAVQLGFDEVKERSLNKPLLGHLKKAGVKALRILREFRDFQLDKPVEPGQEIRVDIFREGDLVDVTGYSKGRGFAGVVKRHRFGGGPKTHGQSDRWRAPGSLGQSSFPSRVFKGLRMAGRMGNRRVTVKNLRVVKVDPENNLLVVKGAVPGSVKGIVTIKRQ
ncbi:MAG: 50S ribosomal protein L3 [candidate division KSB1 bacterium]|nr:50S ribosomal protein L3 [candidate division KSB1 bacterium]